MPKFAGLHEYEKWHQVLDKMSHSLTDDDLRQGRNHRAGHHTRMRSSDAKAYAQDGKDKELDLKFSIARSRAASAGSVL